MIALKTLIFTVLAPGTVAGIVPWLLLQLSGEGTNLTPSLWLIGLLPLLLGVGLYFWCAGAFTFIGKGTPAPIDAPIFLVREGPYRKSERESPRLCKRQMKRRSFSGGWCGEKGLTQGIRPAILGMHVLTEEEQARQMARKGTKSTKEVREPKKQTPTFLLELPLVADPAQAKRLRAHLEAGRQYYNALLSEGQRRLRQMRADPAWQAARAIPHTRTQERAAAFRALREQYEFSDYALQEYGKSARCTWIADHLDSVLAQTLASRA